MKNRTKTGQAVEQEMQELNEQFGEFLHTKGIKAQHNLVVENIKSGAKSAPHDTAAQIAKIHAQTQEAVAHANAHGNLHSKKLPKPIPLHLSQLNSMLS